MLSLLRAVGTLRAVFAVLLPRSETGPSMHTPEPDRWAVALKTHNQFDNWTQIRKDSAVHVERRKHHGYKRQRRLARTL